MRCLECDGKSIVVNTRLSEDNAVVRQRKCTVCGSIFYTLETSVDYDEVADDIRRYYRKRRLICKN